VLSCGIICVILHLALLIQYRSVTDRHTTVEYAALIGSRSNNFGFTLSKGTEDNLKFTNMGGRSLAVLPCDRMHMTSNLRSVLIIIPVLYHF